MTFEVIVRDWPCGQEQNGAIAAIVVMVNSGSREQATLFFLTAGIVTRASRCRSIYRAPRPPQYLPGLIR